ncbi:MAG: hypothetical protein IH931_02860 [candidate division Zixibacteria bacterium]|nr:hypothetical protein [candidate division Zixibacteria bacterium]
MRNLVIMLISVCFAVCLYPSLAEARHRGPGLSKQIGHLKKFYQKQQFRNRHNFKRLLKSLKGDLALTAEQKSELKILRYEFKKTQIDQQAELKKAKLELRYLKRDGAGSKEAVLGAIDDLARAKAELEKLKYLQRQSIRSVFTEKQLIELKELKSKRSHEMRIMKRQGIRHNKMNRRHMPSGHMGI